MEKSYRELIQIHKTNKLAGLYPTTKFLIVLLYSICTFVIGTIPFTKYGLALALIPQFLCILIICAASGEFKKCVSALKKVTFVALVIFLVQTFIVPGGELIWRMGFLRIYEKGLDTAVSLSFLIMNIAGIFVWVFQTTSNKEITRALEASGMNYKMAYTFTSTLQMIDILGANSRTIMAAQSARGVETKGNVMVRAKAFFPSLVPLILGAIISSEERILTLEARGFSMGGEKTHLFEIEKSGIEKPVTIIAVVITIALVVGRVALWIL